MKDAQAQHHDHDVEVKSAKQQYIERGAAQVSGMRAAAEHERTAAYAGAAFTAVSGALEIATAAAAPAISSSVAASPQTSTWSRMEAAAPKALADLTGRVAPFVATLAGGAAAQEDRADATAADHASQVAKMDYDQAREHASRDRDAARSALEGLRTATSSQHEARMAIFRG